MNSDSFAVLRTDFPTGHPFQTAPLVLTSTTETAFLLGNGNVASIGVPSQTAIVGSATPLDPNSNSTFSIDNLGGMSDRRGLAGRPYFTSSSFDGRSFRVRAQGKFTAVTTATAPAFNIKLYVGTSATLGSDTVIFTPTARTLAVSTTVNGNFILEGTFLWDSVTQKVNGEVWAQFADNGAAATYTTRAASAGVSAAAYTNLNFVLSAVYGTNAPTSSTTTLVEFSMEQV